MNSLLFWGNGEKERGSQSVRKSLSVSKWFRAQESQHMAKRAAYLYAKNKNKFWFVFSLDLTPEPKLSFKIPKGKTAVSLAPGYRTAAVPTPVSPASSVAGAAHHTGRSEQAEYAPVGEL